MNINEAVDIILEKLSVDRPRDDQEPILYVKSDAHLDRKVIEALYVIDDFRYRDCGHQCYRIGGPFIAENPDCPFHRRG